MTASGDRLAVLLPAATMPQVPGIVKMIMDKHRQEGCEFFDGAYERVMSDLPPADHPMDLKDDLVLRIEREEKYCPDRDLPSASMVSQHSS